MSQRDSLSKLAHESIYVGEAGSQRAQRSTLRSRLSDNLDKGGWQTALRRLVFEHVLGVPVKSRTNRQYKDQLRESRLQITDEIRRNFAFKCLATKDFKHFEVWLIHKYQDKIWNKRIYSRKVIPEDFTALHLKLLKQPLIPFSDFGKRISSIPDAVGVYLVSKI